MRRIFKEINNIIKPEIHHIIFPMPYNDLDATNQNDLYNNAFNLIQFIIHNNKVLLPSDKYCGKIFRSGKSNQFHDRNGHLPVNNSNDLNEGKFFNFVENMDYFTEIFKQDPIALLMCRKMKDYDDRRNRLNIFINYNNNISCKHIIHDNCIRDTFKRFTCNNDNINELKEQNCRNISQGLQNEINKCIIVPIIKLFGINQDELVYDLTYENIINDAKNIFLVNNIPGYNFQGYLDPFTMHDLLKSWDFRTGVRKSKYSEDRCYIYFVMPLLDIIEQILNYNFNANNDLFHLDIRPYLPLNTQINILGIFVDNTPQINPPCNVFRGEFIIPVKHFKKPERYSIFYPRSPNCNIKSYTYDPNVQGRIRLTGSKPIDDNVMDIVGGKYLTNVKEQNDVFSFNKTNVKSKKSITKTKTNDDDLWGFFAGDFKDEDKYIPSKNTLKILQKLKAFSNNKTISKTKTIKSKTFKPNKTKHTKFNETKTKKITNKTKSKRSLSLIEG